MTRWTGKPCSDCGKKKGPKQANDMRCWTCARAVKVSRSKAAHGQRVEKTYGITEDDYWALYELQGGRCAICRWAKGQKKRLAVDHDHKCPMPHRPEVGCEQCVRGLLCTFCNRLIGKFRDSIEIFQNAIDYLRYPPWKRLQDLRRSTLE